jgi:hypothetical protein
LLEQFRLDNRRVGVGHDEPTELEDMRAACEQVPAADRIGVAGVGSELLLESVIRLRWAWTNAEAVTLE